MRRLQWRTLAAPGKLALEIPPLPVCRAFAHSRWSEQSLSTFSPNQSRESDQEIKRGEHSSARPIVGGGDMRVRQLAAAENGKADRREVSRILKNTELADIAAAIGVTEGDLAVDWAEYLEQRELERLGARVSPQCLLLAETATPLRSDSGSARFDSRPTLRRDSRAAIAPPRGSSAAARARSCGRRSLGRAAMTP